MATCVGSIETRARMLCLKLRHMLSSHVSRNVSIVLVPIDRNGGNIANTAGGRKLIYH